MADKSLNAQNRKFLWPTIAGNVALGDFALRHEEIQALGIFDVAKVLSHAFPIGLAFVLVQLLDPLFSSNAKARLVFWRWENPLPGCEAFSKHGPEDPRVDMAKLEKAHGKPLPQAPDEQNRAWYAMLKRVEGEHAVSETYRHFLFLRAYTAFSAIFFVVGTVLTICFTPSDKVVLIYIGILLTQFLIVRYAARNQGVRFVKTVLARNCVLGPKAKKKKAQAKT